MAQSRGSMPGMPQGHPSQMYGAPQNQFQQFPMLNKSPFAGQTPNSQLSQRGPMMKNPMLGTPFGKPGPMLAQNGSPAGNMFTPQQQSPFGGMQKNPFQPQSPQLPSPQMQQNPQLMSPFGGGRPNPFANPMNMRPPNMMQPNMMNPNMMGPQMMNPNMMNANMMNQKMMQQGMMHPGMMPGMMNPQMMQANMMRMQMAARAQQQQRMINKVREEQRKQQEQEEQEENEAFDRMIKHMEKQTDALNDIATNINQDFDDYRNQRRDKLEKKYMKQNMIKSISGSIDPYARSNHRESQSDRRNRNYSHEILRNLPKREEIYSEESDRSRSQDSDRDRDDDRGSSSQQQRGRGISSAAQRLNNYGREDVDMHPRRNYSEPQSHRTPRNQYKDHYGVYEEINEEESVELSPVHQRDGYSPYGRDNLNEMSDAEENHEQPAEEEEEAEQPQQEVDISYGKNHYIQSPPMRSEGGLFSFVRKQYQPEPSKPALLALTRVQNEALLMTQRSTATDRGHETDYENTRKKPVIIPSVRTNSPTALLSSREEKEEVQEEQQEEQPELKEDEPEQKYEPQQEEEHEEPEQVEEQEEEVEEKPTLFNIKGRKEKKKGKKGKKKKVAKAEKAEEKPVVQEEKIVQAKPKSKPKPKPQEERPSPVIARPKLLIPQDEQIRNIWDVPTLKKESDQKPKLLLPPLSRITPLNASTDNTPRREQPLEVKKETTETEKPVLKINLTEEEPIKLELSRIEPIKPIKQETARIEPIKQEPIKQEQYLKVEEPQQSTKSEEVTNQALNFNKIRSIQLEKKPYTNIPSIVLPVSRTHLDKQQGNETATSTNHVEPELQNSMARRNVRLGTIEQKRGLFSYVKK